ncbi:MAG TPA: zf-HC2 domain-containing protein [Gemmatimonadales bacterium]
MQDHAEWLRQVEAEVEGELTLAERATLARHLASCTHCAGARASHLELRVAMARAAGEPQARAVPRPAIRVRTVMLWALATLFGGAAVGWQFHSRWGAPGGGSLEDARAAVVVQ